MKNMMWRYGVTFIIVFLVSGSFFLWSQSHWEMYNQKLIEVRSLHTQRDHFQDKRCRETNFRKNSPHLVSYVEGRDLRPPSVK
jgi:hypothetical protein